MSRSQIKQNLKKYAPDPIKLVMKWVIGKTVEVPKIKRVNKFLNEKYGYIADKYSNASIPTDWKFDDGQYPIWTMWWQGEEQMPEVIKMCYNSLKKNANGHTINLITKDNYLDFVKIPQNIVDKVEQNAISLNHLSDIIRASLLSECGGLWVDATIFITDPLPKEINAAYWTPKWKVGYNRLWDGLSAVSSIPPNTIMQAGFLWYSCKQNPLFTCLKEFWLTFCQNENTHSYYFLAELFLIGTMYNRIPTVKQLADAVPFNNEKCLVLGMLANKPYRPSVVSDILRNTSFHKLSWKDMYTEIILKTGEQTVYGFLKKMY